MLTNFDLNTCSSCNIDDLLDKIDKKISKEAKRELNNQIYILKRKNCDEKDDRNIIEDLYYYRNILIKKSYNDPCLCNYNMDIIISKIKKLIR